MCASPPGGLLQAAPPVRQVSVRWSPRGCKMLTDMILEEEFDQDEEPWYDPQDLEHGKSCAAVVAP